MNPALREIYDEFAETYEAGRGRFDMAAILAPFFAGLDLPKGRLLDLGCGAGEPFPRYFLDRGWEVYGVDFSKKMLHLAALYAPEMKTICADMLDVEFEPEHFDAITSIYSLFHVPRARHPELFAKLRRWLRPGGKALFTYATAEYTGRDEFEGYKEFMGRQLFYSHLTRAQLNDALAQAGLRLASADLRAIGGETFLWVAVARP
jgi:cyclopropane fatty-acyl-phospholipid synthase-like methyltransferase